mmetsp:Transcript_34501/g.73517  ORF Transcript_34501/g.73517 Transcript_34501/m.73517 type:complete len:235 (+) Transcript_34501:1375-2079(+)
MYPLSQLVVFLLSFPSRDLCHSFRPRKFLANSVVVVPFWLPGARDRLRSGPVAPQSLILRSGEESVDIEETTLACEIQQNLARNFFILLVCLRVGSTPTSQVPVRQEFRIGRYLLHFFLLIRHEEKLQLLPLLFRQRLFLARALPLLVRHLLRFHQSLLRVLRPSRLRLPAGRRILSGLLGCMNSISIRASTFDEFSAFLPSATLLLVPCIFVRALFNALRPAPGSPSSAFRGR